MAIGLIDPSMILLAIFLHAMITFPIKNVTSYVACTRFALMLALLALVIYSFFF